MGEVEHSELVRKALALLGVPRPDWNAEFRVLEDVTNNIRKEDPRSPFIKAALEQCDTAYLAGDWLAFHRAAELVKAMVEGGRAR